MKNHREGRNAKKDIAKISDLSKKNATADTLIPLLNDTRLLLSQVDNNSTDLANSKKAGGPESSRGAE